MKLDAADLRDLEPLIIAQVVAVQPPSLKAVADGILSDEAIAALATLLITVSESSSSPEEGT